MAGNRSIPVAGRTITFRIYNYAQVDRKALTAAETEATDIFANAGVTAVWMDCPTSSDAVTQHSGCEARPQANDYILRLSSKDMLDANVAVSDSSRSVCPRKTVRSAAYIQMARDRQCLQIHHCNIVRCGAAHERA